MSNLVADVVADLAERSPEIIARLDPDELAMFQEWISARALILKRASAALLAGLERRYSDKLKSGTGTQHIEDGDFDIKYELPKRVEWDSERLEAIGDMSPEASKLMRWKADVLESAYNSAPPAVQRQLDKARTVKSGAPKFTITRRKAE